MLESLERSNRFVVALDRDRGWYRCHHARPGAAGRRACAARTRCSSRRCCAARSTGARRTGRRSAAIRYGQADGDPDRVAAAMERWSSPCTRAAGSPPSSSGSAGWTPTAARADIPAVAVIGALFHAATGRPTASDRWAAAAEHGSHAGPLPDGSRVDRVLAGAAARVSLPATASRRCERTPRWQSGRSRRQSPWHPARARAPRAVGAADRLDRRGRRRVRRCGRRGRTSSARQTWSPSALAERAVIAIGRGEWARADEFAEPGGLRCSRTHAWRTPRSTRWSTPSPRGRPPARGAHGRARAS